MVFGTPHDRPAFTSAIRAFALAGRWGDRLTIVGYGDHRRRLEKWTRALRIDNAVSFAEPGDPTAASVVLHDVAILVSRQCDWAALLLHALLEGLCVLAIDGNDAATALLGDGQLGMLFPSCDVIALSHAMIEVTEPDPAAIRLRLPSDVSRSGD